MRWRCLLGLGAICSLASAPPEPTWTLARSAHFEVYSQAGEASAWTTLGWFEQLHAFFSGQMTIDFDRRPPVRVIGFRSPVQYLEYNPRPTSDAYYVGSESRDYIVMSKLGPDQFSVAAHEYAHLVLHAGGLRLPSWLSEGLAEVLSSIRISAKSTTLDGYLPGRWRILNRPWIPLAELFSITADSPLRSNRDSTNLFYAQSWALTHMLVFSADYAPDFPRLVTALASGTPGSEALTAVYRKPLDAIARDAQAWIRAGHSTSVALPGIPSASVAVEVTGVSPLESQLLLGELLFASGQLDRAERLYTALDRRTPGTPAVAGALGSIALRKGDRDGARMQWRRAMEFGISDPFLCYRDAVLAQEAGMDVSEIRGALERAITLQTDFDDARFKLALLEMNQSRFETAVEQFRAMKTIKPERAYGYWSGLAYALTELDRREEAKTAASAAARFATTSEERARPSLRPWRKRTCSPPVASVR